MPSVDAILSATKKTAEFYDRLGCDRGSTPEQIHAEYKVRVRDVHPDKALPEEKEHATQQFAVLQHAYQVLSDEKTRKLYDSWLSTPVPCEFEEFCRNQDLIKMSTHWATPKEQKMISVSDLLPKTDKKSSGGPWSDGKRYESTTASRFRNYQL